MKKATFKRDKYGNNYTCDTELGVTAKITVHHLDPTIGGAVYELTITQFGRTSSEKHFHNLNKAKKFGYEWIEQLLNK